MTFLSDIFPTLSETDTTCETCSAKYQIQEGGIIEWTTEFGAECIDLELTCDCEFKDTEPFPHVRFDGESIQFLMKSLPVCDIQKSVDIPQSDTDIETDLWHRMGDHIGMNPNDYWHFSKKWHDHATAIKQKIDSRICPNCDRELQTMGKDLFCIECDFDTLEKLS